MDLDYSPVDIVDHTIRNAYFDEVIGHIEDIILSEVFVNMHTQFFELHFQCFEDTDENRHEYMDIFLEYVNTFENFLVKELHTRMSNFDMKRFDEELSKDDDFKCGNNYHEIFELLHTFNNFQAFKDFMLDYRLNKERKLQNLDLDNILVTKSCARKDLN